MGRNYTGADYTTSAFTLDAGHLRRSGVIAPGKTVHATSTWPGGEAVDIVATWTEQEQSLHLTARIPDPYGQVQTWTQRIRLQTAPSNLGQGELLYFLCPRSGKRCRKIYRAYYSQGFYHREAFSHRLYYPVQASSRLKVPDRKHAATERALERLEAMRRTSTYRGLPTRRALRIAKLQEELLHLDDLRWSPAFMPKRLQGLLSKFL